MPFREDLKPDRLVPKAQAPEEQGIERVLLDKYYVDELYDRTIVKPTVWASRNVLSTGVDQGIIDKLLVTWVGATLVHESREERALLGAMRDAVARHADLLVPLQQIQARREQRLAAREPDHLFVGLLRSHDRSGVCGGCEGALDR